MRDVKLVTGSSGFIGHKVCQFLLERGDNVVGIDNMNDYYDIALKEYRLKSLINYNNFKFHKVDIECLNDLKKIFNEYKISTVFNIAARAGVRYSIINPWIYLRTNIEGTLNILECMKDFKVNKFVLASTSSLYAGLKMPFKEDLPINTPISQYAASKCSAEALAFTYHKQYSIDVSILRYFTVFGPLGRPDMAPYRFCKWILDNKPLIIYGTGNFLRDFTYIDDIARGTVLSEKNVGFQIINLGGGNEPISMNQFIKIIEDITGIEAVKIFKPANGADMEYTMANIEKAKKILNWEPQISVKEGLRRMLENKHHFIYSEY